MEWLFHRRRLDLELVMADFRYLWQYRSELRGKEEVSGPPVKWYILSVVSIGSVTHTRLLADSSSNDPPINGGESDLHASPNFHESRELRRRGHA